MSTHKDKKNDGGRCVFIRRDKKIVLVKRANNYSWDSAGGAVDKGEEIEEAALREFEEETGISQSIIKESPFKIVFDSEYIQFDGTKLYTFFVKMDKESEFYKKFIPKNINEVSHGESLAVDFFTTREIFKMRENTVDEKEGEKINWGSFKPFLHILDEKKRDKSKKLSDSFGENYGPFRFYKKK